ncbi:hypothetical protein [Kordia jejudonensis]|uniref:hypothetical protein n=1 Tax=Kordia jejudonensis TaxID=1348245 RepID=UPI0006296242|nr:hypothetical protein [Kordia jejudonensis]
MSSNKKTKYNNKIKLLQSYKDTLDDNFNSISKKELLEYILQELKELKKKNNNKANNLTVDELLDTFKNIKLKN